MLFQEVEGWEEMPAGVVCPVCDCTFNPHDDVDTSEEGFLRHLACGVSDDATWVASFEEAAIEYTNTPLEDIPDSLESWCKEGSNG